jgi:ABC-type multidrug transport system fused ATPase/permease subunit
LFISVVRRIQEFSRRMTKQFSFSKIEELRFEKLHSLGIQSLEDPEVNNMLQNAKNWMWDIPNVSLGFIRIIAALVKSVLTGIVLLNKIPILVPILIVSAGVSFYQSRNIFKKDFGWQTREDHLDKKRSQWWTSDDLTNPVSLSEISITGAYDYLSKKFISFFNYFNNGLIGIFKLDFFTGLIVDVLESGLIFYGYIRVFTLLLEKTITVGDTTLYMSAIRNFQSGLSWFATELVIQRDLAIKVGEVYKLFKLEPKVSDGGYKLERLINPPSIEFNNVTFKYPNTKTNVLENFNLKIVPGEKIAVVGENGAGKSTMVKLLCRLYDPQEGTILINGRDLKDIEINDWYKNIGVLFQDFNFYDHLTAEENIYLGKPAKAIDKEKIVEAAKNAEAHEFIQKYPSKYKTIMTERFKGGIRPSNGQKQKLAIARFFYRNAPFAIFDEPTSAIDAQAEYKIFNRIYNFFDNKSVIIISHRFSTVRNADRILVVEGGKIAEEGSHKELLSLGGIYADSFKKQAEGYL